MTHDKEFWERAISVGTDCDPQYGADQIYVSYPKLFATVNLYLNSTSELDYIMDEKRTASGHKPFYFADDESEIVDGCYDYYIGINDIDGGCVDNAISCVVCSYFEDVDDNGDCYAIPLDEEDRQIVWKILDNKLRKYSWEQKSCKELLAEARKWLEKEIGEE